MFLIDVEGGRSHARSRSAPAPYSGRWPYPSERHPGVVSPERNKVAGTDAATTPRPASGDPEQGDLEKTRTRASPGRGGGLRRRKGASSEPRGRRPTAIVPGGVVTAFLRLRMMSSMRAGYTLVLAKVNGPVCFSTFSSWYLARNTEAHDTRAHGASPTKRQI